MNLFRETLRKARAYNDRKARLIGVPLIALAVTAGCMTLVNERYLDYLLYFYPLNLISTVLYWEGNRLISIFFRLKYPLVPQIGRRLLGVSVAITIYCLLIPAIEFPLSMKMLDWIGLSNDGAEMWIYVLTGFGISAVATVLYESVYFFQNWQTAALEAERLKLLQVQTELDSLKNQVNPHFLFNNLNTLSSLIPQDPEQAVQFVAQLSRVYRYVLEISSHTLIPLEEELAFLDSYAFLLTTRHGARFSLQVEVPAACRRALVTPLALQLLVENAVKHNIISARRPLTVRIYTEDGWLKVENNLQAKLHATPGARMGLNNIRNRYQLIAGKEIRIEHGENRFCVSLPLLPAQESEREPLPAA